MSEEFDTHEKLMRAIHEYFEANMAFEQLKSKSKSMRVYKAAVRLKQLSELRLREVKLIRNTYRPKRKKSEYNEAIKERIKYYQDKKVVVNAAKLIEIHREVNDEFKEEKGQDSPNPDQSSDK